MNNITFSSPILSTLLSIGGFVIFWIIVIGFVGRVSGWGKLAQAFPYSGMSLPGTHKKRFQAIKINMSNYGGIVDFESLPQGLHVSVFYLFKMGHPDILIPWQELQIEQKTRTFWQGYSFVFMSVPKIKILTSKNLGEWIWREKVSMGY